MITTHLHVQLISHRYMQILVSHILSISMPSQNVQCTCTLLKTLELLHYHVGLSTMLSFYAIFVRALIVACILMHTKYLAHSMTLVEIFLNTTV